MFMRSWAPDCLDARRCLLIVRDLVVPITNAVEPESKELTTLRLVHSPTQIIHSNAAMSLTSTREIDSLMSELKALRQKVVIDGDRVERQLAEYAELNQSVTQLTKIISDGLRI